MGVGRQDPDCPPWLELGERPQPGPAASFEYKRQDPAADWRVAESGPVAMGTQGLWEQPAGSQAGQGGLGTASETPAVFPGTLGSQSWLESMREGPWHGPLERTPVCDAEVKD